MITWNIRRRIQVHSMFMECTLASGTFEIIVSCFSCWGWLSSWDWNILWCNYILAFSSYFLGWKLLRISPGLPVSPSGAKLSVQALTTSWTHRKADLDPCYYVWSSFSFFYYSLQGLSERMSKVKCLWKSQFSQKISFLNCFRSEISGKFMPYSIQVHQNHPEASLEAGASDVLSGCDRLFEADH